METTVRKSLHVLVVDDSAVVRQATSALLSREEDLTVAVAADPLIAIDKMKKVRPDVILLDLEMPRMHGLTFLQKVMAEEPVPVVVCSGLTGEGSDLAIRAMEAGAVAVVTKPKLGVRGFLEESAILLVDSIRGAARARLRRRVQPVSHPAPKLTADVVLRLPPRYPAAPHSEAVVAIGASTGGTEALKAFLEEMPESAPGIAIVQHMPEVFTRAFARRLDQTCRIAVKEAESGDRIHPGRALVAAGNRHLILKRGSGGYFVQVSEGPLVSRHRPSVDVLFRSVALAAGENAVGVILTGMGDDGARGLKEMREAGAATIAQDEATCVVFGMPREAIELGAVEQVLPLSRIPAEVLRKAHEKSRRAPAPPV